MDQIVVTATAGRALGSRPSRRLRAEGKLPGVVYGLGKDPLSIALDYAELRDVAGLGTLHRPSETKVQDFDEIPNSYLIAKHDV